MADKAAFPESFRDPLYASLDASNEQKLGLPVGLVAAIRERGERTDASKVSSAGASTPYQFIPATRKAILDQFGIDVALSPQNASEGAALLLKQNYDRTGGDVEKTVRQYHGGTDPKNWGPVNNAYWGRVSQGLTQAKTSALDNDFAAWMKANPASPPAATPAGQPAPNWGNRADGTPKGNGFLGVINRPDGGVSTELSVGVNIGGKEVEIPSLVPTLTKDEIQQVVSLKDGERMPESVIAKAIAFAQPRIAAGKSPFAGLDESPKPASKIETLAQGFGDFLRAQRPAEQRIAEGVAQIPGQDGNPVPTPAPAAADPSLVDRALGVGEAGLALGSGMLAAPVGAAAGAMGALADGNLRDVYPAMQRGAQALTYQPRTAAGQDYTQAVGNVMQEALPLAPLAGEAALLRQATGNAVPPTVTAIRNAPAAVAEAARPVTAAVSRGVDAVIPGRPAQRAPTPGTMASGGAAGTDAATLRRAAAQELEVPIDLTKGQATRSFEDQQFEREIAKDAERGSDVRDRYADQNQALLRNFDASFDKTGAMAPDLRRAGVAVTDALESKAKRDHAEVNVKYARARKSEEANAVVDHERPVKVGEGDDAVTSTPIAFINEQPAGLPSTAVTDAARQYAVKRGIATLDDGELVPNPKATIKQFEDWRKDINGATGYEPADIRQATILKKLIDGQTEPIAGPLYRDARRARELYARQYEDRAVISDLLRTKKGSSDRQVALEDVFGHSILNRSLDDVRHVRRVLQTGGEEGQQAWRELQGQAIAYLKDQATKNVARDIRGNQIVSPAGLDRALRPLQADGKLDFIFGKKGAEQLRTINDVVNHIHTAPPGSVNHSNTASVLAAAFDLILSGSTGLPLPIASGLKHIGTQVKNAKVRRRIQESLGQKQTPSPAPPPRPNTLH